MKGPVKTILVVDDEPDAIELVEFNLRAAGYGVIAAEDGEEAIRKAREGLPDLIVLDVMLPEVDGMAACRTLKNDPITSDIPVIMLTAKAAEIDRILGLELGADDYVTKPFSPRELVLRIKNLLSRQDTKAAPLPAKIVVGKLTIDSDRHLVLVSGEPVELTATEFKLLSVLASRRGRCKTASNFCAMCGSTTTTLTPAPWILTCADCGVAADYLGTVRGVGYRFAESSN